MIRFSKATLLALFLGILAGCGGSDDFVESTATGSNVGAIQVQVDSSRLAAQTTSNSDYEIEVVNQQGEVIRIGIFQRPPEPQAPDPVPWRLPNIPVGRYDVNVTGRMDEVAFVRYEVTDVSVNAGLTTIIGDGSGATQGFTVVSLNP